MTPPGKRAGGGSRDERLEAALRENLKRRKAQARRRSDDSEDAAGEGTGSGETPSCEMPTDPGES
ncbi:MAG: hypothetical protein JNM89_13140 [Hyphomicrobiaceae bacterium]|nr:hypothetical protein [Hyphomicrobiaceae bacterium]